MSDLRKALYEWDKYDPVPSVEKTLKRAYAVVDAARDELDRIEELERQVREARAAAEKMHRRAQRAEGVYQSLLSILNGWNKIYAYRTRDTSDWITREVLREMAAKIEKAAIGKLAEGVKDEQVIHDRPGDCRCIP